MIEAILGLINGVLGFLNGLLPSSPFSGLLGSNEASIVAIGWLNWLFPVGECLAIFTTWLLALVAWTAVDIVLDAAAAARNAAFGSGYTG